MALSENEQAEFEQIQARLLEDDPRFVKRAARSTPGGRRGRHLRIAISLLSAGFLLLLAIVIDLAYGVIGFTMMFAGVVLGVRALQTVEGDFGTRVRELLQREGGPTD